MTTCRRALSVLSLGLALAAPRFAYADSKIEMAVATDSKETTSGREVFGPDTPKVYIVYTVTTSKASRVKGVWWAEKVQGVPDNSKMTESASNVQAGTFMMAFSYPKPPTGWPSGTYKVELFVDDKLEKTVKFKVAK